MIYINRNQKTGKVWAKVETTQEEEEEQNIVLPNLGPDEERIVLELEPGSLAYLHDNGDGDLYLMESPESTVPETETEIRKDKLDRFTARACLPEEPEPEVTLDEFLEALQTKKPSGNPSTKDMLDARNEVREHKKEEFRNSHAYRSLSRDKGAKK